jgi:eukaryotic-like serine/threonine-protein kinase
LRFLIIDDDAEYRGILRYQIGVEWPYASIEEHEPVAAPDLPDLDGVNLILLGHPVAGERGFETLRRLRATRSPPPVILLAAESDEFLAVDAIKAGAANFFARRKIKHRRLVEAMRAAMRATDLDSTDALFMNHKALLNGRRRLVSKLYAGELASVYLAESEDDGERIAFKVFRHVQDSGSRGRLLDRFIREYEVIARVNHPNVVRIFDLGVADNHAYIAMEYLGAGNLAERLERPLPLSTAIEYLREIASALAAIHDAGILHRDLKPANIMFRDDGTLALIDFGLAKEMRLQAAITGTGEIFGTPYYMSPEQGHAEPTDARSDLYSLGCIFFEMLTAERPFRASTPMGVIYKHAHAPRPRLPVEVRAQQPLLERMLAVDPAARFQSAAELLEAL